MWSGFYWAWRSRFLPWHDLLPDAVVSGSISCSGYRIFHGGDPAFNRRGRARVQRASGDGWSLRDASLAMAIHFRGSARPTAVGRVLFYLTDRPVDAEWLADDERRWLVDRLAAEEQQREAALHYSVLQALLNPRVLALSLVYFGAVAANYGLSFFLPQIVKRSASNLQTGFVAAIPYAVGVVAIVWWGRPGRKTRTALSHRLRYLRRRRRLSRGRLSE